LAAAHFEVEVPQNLNIGAGIGETNIVELDLSPKVCSDRVWVFHHKILVL
jgi:hypothetical protein